MTDYNAAEPAHIRDAERSARQAELERHEVLRGIMSVGPGRKWMWDLLVSAHMFSSSFSTSALQMAFTEGERNIGLRLMVDLQAACPQLYQTMVQEANERGRAADNRRKVREPEPEEVA